jgi:hypothetical protein
MMTSGAARARKSLAAISPCAETSPVHLDIIVYDGLDEMDALGPLEVFRGARDAGAEIDANW